MKTHLSYGKNWKNQLRKREQKQIIKKHTKKKRKSKRKCNHFVLEKSHKPAFTVAVRHLFSALPSPVIILSLPTQRAVSRPQLHTTTLHLPQPPLFTQTPSSPTTSLCLLCTNRSLTSLELSHSTHRLTRLIKFDPSTTTTSPSLTMSASITLAMAYSLIPSSRYIVFQQLLLLLHRLLLLLPCIPQNPTFLMSHTSL